MLSELRRPENKPKVKIETRPVDGVKWVKLFFPDLRINDSVAYVKVHMLVTEQGVKISGRKQIRELLEKYEVDLLRQVNDSTRVLFNTKGSNAIIYQLGGTRMLIKENRRGTSTSYFDALNRMDILEHLCRNDPRIPVWVGVPPHFALLEFFIETTDEYGDLEYEFKSYMLMEQVNSGLSLQDWLSFCDGQIDDSTRLKITSKYGGLSITDVDKSALKQELEDQLRIFKESLELVTSEYSAQNPLSPDKLLVDLFQNANISRNYGNIIIEMVDPGENGGKRFKFWIIDQ